MINYLTWPPESKFCKLENRSAIFLLWISDGFLWLY